MPKSLTQIGEGLLKLYQATERILTRVERASREIYRAWPKHPGSGRYLRLEELSPWYAASEAVDQQVYRKKPRVLEAFLKDWVRLKKVERYEIEALWELVRKKNAEPIDPALWDADKALAYLREEVPKRAYKIRKARRLEDKARGLYRVPFRKLFPEYYRPTYFGDPQLWASKRKPGIKGPPAHNSEDVSGEGHQIFEGEEDRANFLKAARRFLPRRRHEILRLRLQGLSDEEIASELGIARSTVRVHRWAARQDPALKALVRRWFGVG
jgi:DNA-directed RNA polymerase specialized sigma24 family protein